MRLAGFGPVGGGGLCAALCGESDCFRDGVKPSMLELGDHLSLEERVSGLELVVGDKDSLGIEKIWLQATDGPFPFRCNLLGIHTHASRLLLYNFLPCSAEANLALTISTVSRASSLRTAAARRSSGASSAQNSSARSANATLPPTTSPRLRASA